MNNSLDNQIYLIYCIRNLKFFSKYSCRYEMENLEQNGVINVWSFFIETLKKVGLLIFPNTKLSLSGSAATSNQFCAKPFKR